MSSVPRQRFLPRREFLCRTVKCAAQGSLAAGLLGSAPFQSQLYATEGVGSGRIKVGQIGVGHAHATKLSVFRQSADYEVVGVVESDPALRQKFAQHPAYQGIPWMSQEQLLNRDDLQLVLVETEVRDLLTAAEAAVTAGKHVHLDKPAGANLPHYRRLLEQASRKGLLVQMGYMYRYNPGVQLLQEFLKNGWLGELFEVHTVMSKVVDDDSRRKLAEFSGGIMFELGCHILDLVIALLGEPVAVEPHIQHFAGSNDTLADNMLAVLTYPRALATVKSSAVEVEGGARRHLVVCGSQGTFQIQPLDNPQVRVALDQPRGPYKRGYQDIRLPAYNRYVSDAADIAAIIRGDKASHYSYEHDLLVQTTLLKCCKMDLE